MKRQSRRQNRWRPAFMLMLLLLVLRQWGAAEWQSYPVGRVFLLNQNQPNDPRLIPYRPLLRVAGGAAYKYQDIRSSIENLYRTGTFANIESRIKISPDKSIDVYFVVQNKPTIRSLRFTPPDPIGSRQLQDALYSLRKNDLYEESKMAKAMNELQALFKAKGYFSAQVSPQVSLNERQDSCSIHFIIAYGPIARIRKLTINVDDGQLAKTVASYFKKNIFYTAAEFAGGIDKTKKLLKQQLYYHPEIKIQEEFLNPQRSQLDITIHIACGYKYMFEFRGMAAKMSLIASVWEQEVFEKWAEAESRSRLLNYLKNKGFLNAEITSAITTQGNKKTIVFTASKNRRFKLGKITFQGNQALSDATIREIINSDDLIFNKLFWLRLNSLLVDMEVLKLYYYYQGISPVAIRLEPRFHANRADIDFIISESPKYTVENVEFSGNHAFAGPELYRLIKSRTGSPYVPKQFSEDIDRLQNFYWNNGFDEAAVTYELSPGEQKSLLIKIDEKRMKKMGEFIIIGASNSQKKLLKKLFPLQAGQPFSKEKIDAFRTEIENSAIFSQIKLDKIVKERDLVDVLIKVIPDRSRFYGFGFGWQERSGTRTSQGILEVLQGIAEELRGTLEYQEKNLFNSISSLNFTMQLGLKEQRGILSIDTPYFFNNKIPSSFKIWDENEAYPSYQFNRWGLGVSVVKKFSEKLYLLGSIKWYRTKLTELKIPPFGVDQVGRSFDTTAFSLSFVNEKRNNPINPSSGSFLSADMKLGLPLFEKDYTFLKFFWNYQQHYSFLHDCIFSFSIKNGFAFGDMSITERFFAGGSLSFRGTRPDRLGPIDLAKNEPEGGNVLFLVNLEVTVPSLLIPMQDLYYTFFADVGNVFAKSSDLNFNKMERALGFGLKLRTGMGPIRLDFAFNLRRLAEKNFLIQIGFGNVY
ncbi:MAG: BamA/TamA family outer membrane protein [Candidatus Aminicenantes bacterium]|nr:BamA/TamA family outer membrane protein [Candidatus Aminicenantes bacterium]